MQGGRDDQVVEHPLREPHVERGPRDLLGRHCIAHQQRTAELV